MTRFDACLAVVLQHEGGFVNHPSDPGGATNMGITIGTLHEWRGRPVTVDDVRALGRVEAAAIYRARYWTPLYCDDLPPGVDLMAFDFGVNAGTGRSSRLLQRVAGVIADGFIGPKTLAAVRGKDAADFVNALAEERRAYYRGLHTFQVFGKGWLRRVASVQREALEAVATVRLAA